MVRQRRSWRTNSTRNGRVRCSPVARCLDCSVSGSSWSALRGCRSGPGRRPPAGGPGPPGPPGSRPRPGPRPRPTGRRRWAARRTPSGCGSAASMPSSPRSTVTARCAWEVPTTRAAPSPVISVTGPAARPRPWCMTTTWVQVCSTSPSRWLDRMTVRPVGRVTEQDVAHLPDLRRVQAVHRLVEHQQVGQAEHGLGDGQPLAHPPRVGCGPGGRGRRPARRSPGPRPGARRRRDARSPASTGPGWPGRTGAAGSRAPPRTSRAGTAPATPGRTRWPKIVIVPGVRVAPGPSARAAWWSCPRRSARAGRGSGPAPPAATARPPRAGRPGSAWSAR